ncbi:MAG: hypothetical protein IKC69_02780 [Clostridia bacterium]|nr:hypothetical protein [Clostridia bacterium]
MKRAVAYLLILLTLLPLFSCQNTEAPAETEQVETVQAQTAPKEESEEEETKANPNEIVPPLSVNDPLTWDKINALPIANSSMSIAELRQLCIDFFCLQVTFTWTPKKAVHYIVTNFNHPVTYKKGGLYAGIPYVNAGSGNLYRVMDYYDSETGIFDVSMLERSKKLLGNSCSSSAGVAWGRVINSAELGYTSGHTPKLGFLPLGPYTANYEIERFDNNEHGIDVEDVIAANDVQTMYQSYALLQPADGIISGGHVRMVKESAVVVYNADGTINGKESYCIFVEQGCYCSSALHTRYQEDGSKYQIQGNDNLKVSFEELVKKYLPFTFAEFLGTDPVEKSEVSLNLSGTDITVTELMTGTATSNYIITDAYCNIRDAEGKIVLFYAFRQEDHFLKSFNLSSVIPAAALEKYYDQNCTIEFQAQLSTGERPVFYSGALIKG